MMPDLLLPGMAGDDPPEPPDDDPDEDARITSVIAEEGLDDVHHQWEHGKIGDAFHNAHCRHCRPLRGRHRKPVTESSNSRDGFPEDDDFTACWVAVMDDGIVGVFADPEDGALHSEKYGSVLAPVPYYAKGEFVA
jgi:hypothetical protein